MTCASCRDLLWDSLHGLLEADREGTVRAHLGDCPACRSALVEAEALRKELRGCLRLPVEIPPFEAPELTATLPFPARPALPGTGRQLLQPWSWAAVAAGILLVVGLTYGVYQRGLSERQAALAAARQELIAQLQERDATAARLRAVPVEILNRQRDQLPRLRVLGPDSYQPGAPGVYRLTVSDLHGSPVTARVAARLLDDKGAVLAELPEVEARGEATFVVPANLKVKPGAEGRLEVTARHRDRVERFESPVRLLGPAFTASLTLAKPVLQAGETLFFRSLVLDRHGRQPPKQFYAAPDAAFTVGYRLRRQEVVVFDRQGRVQPEGIGGGDYPTADNLPEGDYTLEMYDSQGRFTPVTQAFYVYRPGRLQKSLTFDRPAYRPGEEITARFKAEKRTGDATGANQPYAAKVVVLGKPVGPPVTGQTDAAGNATITWRLPQAPPQAPATLVVEVGPRGQTESLVKPVPLELPGVVAELTPEGGSLLPGVPNRVYVRTHDPLGRPVDFTGPLVDRQGKPVAEVTTRAADSGLGQVTLTPSAGETYSLQSKDGKPVASLAGVFAGKVALRLDPSVVEAGQPLRVEVASADRRPVTVLVTAGGHLVAAESVEATTNFTGLKVPLPAEVRGLLRVTVADGAGAPLQTLAERLAYRVPDDPLNLSVRTEQTGNKVNVRVRTNGKQTGPGWVGIAVVHADALGHETRTPDPATPYLLGAELGRADEPALVESLLAGLNQDAAQARVLLDRFLATRPVAIPDKAPRPNREPTLARGLLQGDTAAEGEAKAQALALADFQSTVADLDRRVRGHQEHVSGAAGVLNAYLAGAGDNLRLGFGALAVAALLTACALLLAATRRALQEQAAPLPLFAGALANLALCLVVGLGMFPFVGGNLDATDDSLQAALAPVTPPDFAVLAQRDLPPARRVLALRLPAPAGQPTVARVDERIWNLVEQHQARATLRPPGTGTTPGAPIGIATQGPNVPKPAIMQQPVMRLLAPRAYPLTGQTDQVLDLLYWNPALPLKPDGTAETSFALPAATRGTYRVVVLGHQVGGRLGGATTNLPLIEGKPGR